MDRWLQAPLDGICAFFSSLFLQLWLLVSFSRQCRNGPKLTCFNSLLRQSYLEHICGFDLATSLYIFICKVERAGDGTPPQSFTLCVIVANIMTDGRTDSLSHTLTMEESHVASLIKFRQVV